IDETNSIAERERTAKLIAKTRASIRKKHRALKTGIMESEIALEKRFKPIVEPLRQIIDITERDKQSKIGDVVKVKTPKGKREHSDNDNNDNDVNDVNDDVIARKSKCYVFGFIRRAMYKRAVLSLRHVALKQVTWCACVCVCCAEQHSVYRLGAESMCVYAGELDF
ncbi:hypothetical protein ALC62_02427, partial [Cyphomyrmex costatus]